MFSAGQEGYQRTDLRIVLDAGAVVIHGDTALTARLTDVSRSGAALSAILPPPRDAAVTLELGNLTVGARVAWTVGRRFGLQFDTRLKATDIFLISHQNRAGPPA